MSHLSVKKKLKNKIKVKLKKMSTLPTLDSILDGILEEFNFGKKKLSL